MDLPVIGLNLKNRKFVPLLNIQPEQENEVLLYREDFIARDLFVYACIMKVDGTLDKVYKIGKIELPYDELVQLLENLKDNSKDKKQAKIISRLLNDSSLEIILQTGKGKRFVQIKKYTIDIFDEIENCDNEEREKFFLDYGDFVKRERKQQTVQIEELTKDGNFSLKEETLSEKQKNKPEEKKSSEKKHISFSGFILRIFGLFFCILVLLASVFFVKFYFDNSIEKAKESSRVLAEVFSKSAEIKINSIKKSAFLFYEIYQNKKENNVEFEKIKRDSFLKNTEIAAIIIGNNEVICNDDFFRMTGADKSSILKTVEYNKDAYFTARTGTPVLKNVSRILKTPSTALFFSVDKNKMQENVTVVFSENEFNEICFSLLPAECFITDKNGIVISALDQKKVKNAESAKDFLLLMNDEVFLNKAGTFKYNDLTYFGSKTRIKNCSSDFVVIVPYNNPIEKIKKRTIKAIKKKTDLEKKIGEVSFIYGNADRKKTDCLFYEKINPGTEIFSGDLVRTKDGAFCRIELTDGTEYEISENSKVKLFFDLKLCFNSVFLNEDSAVNVNLSRTINETLINADEMPQILAKKNSIANIQFKKNNLNAVVEKGKLDVAEENGYQSFAQGKGFSIDENGVLSRKPVAVFEPVIEQGDFSCLVKVDFFWNVNNDRIKKIKMVCSCDEKFNDIVFEKIIDAEKKYIKQQFSYGTYFWKIIPLTEELSVFGNENNSVQTGSLFIDRNLKNVFAKN